MGTWRKTNFFRIIRLFSLVIGCLATVVITHAQGLPLLQVNGKIGMISCENTYKDFTIPASAAGKHLYLAARGGDGGRINFALSTVKGEGKGGQGASVNAYLTIGSGTGEIPVGSTLRFIVGARGASYTNNGQKGRHGGGGGGGTGVLFLKPSVKPEAARSEDWTILMVAGGGGGGYAKWGGSMIDGLPGNDSATGTGMSTGNHQACDAVKDFYQWPGLGTDVGGGGGTGFQYIKDLCSNYAENPDYPIGGELGGFQNTVRNGVSILQPIGHAGGTAGDGNNGGFGFGAGGAASSLYIGAGGGYSGGDYGEIKHTIDEKVENKAGGGGSYLNSSFNKSDLGKMIKNGTTSNPGDGYVRYQFLDALPGQVSVNGVRDLAIQPDGTLWKISNEAASNGNYNLYLRRNNSWERMSRPGTRIAVGPDGIPWLIDASYHIYRADDSYANAWTQLPGSARDIGVDNSGRAWIIGNTKVSGGYAIYYWNGEGWTGVSGGATRIAAGDVPWLINENQNIYKGIDPEQGKWQKLSGNGRDIAVNPAGQVFVVGTSGTVYQRQDEKWAPIGLSGEDVSAGDKLVVGSSSGIYTWQPIAEDGPVSLRKGFGFSTSQSRYLLKAGDFTLSWQGDGNLVLYNNGNALWSSHTVGKGAGLYFQSDGNLVIRDSSGKSIWTSETPDNWFGGKGGDRIQLSAYGTLVMINADGKVLKQWH